MADSGRGGAVKQVRHGFPPVPGDVTQAHVLRRYLQGLRDALQNYRWLFDGLGDLTGAQQQRLVATLRQLSGVQQVAVKQQQQIGAVEGSVAALQALLTALDGRVLALDGRVAAAEARLDALEAWRLTAVADIAALQVSNTHIRTNCCP